MGGEVKIETKCQPRGAGGIRSPPATPHRLQYLTTHLSKIADGIPKKNPKWPPGGPKKANGVWRVVYHKDFVRSRQLSRNKFIDPSTPSMWKGDNGKKGGGDGKRMIKIVATNVVASRPPKRRPTGTPTVRAKSSNFNLWI